jgi:hypothetical protein
MFRGIQVIPRGMQLQRVSTLLFVLLSLAATGCDGRMYWMRVDTRPLLGSERGAAGSRAAEIREWLTAEFIAVALERGMSPNPPAASDGSGPETLASFGAEWKENIRGVRVGGWLEERKPGVYKAWVTCFPDFDTPLVKDFRRDLRTRVRKRWPGAKLRYGLSGW